ncbi:uncharacterized protein LOC110875461 [Helianthus annuus]|uniref:uncharacterized protein LOC110875461 n=1 Tax=Helianthus annuus TaxID=4232 RepID=UPI000B8FD0B0|nr:uncharacterized protein LOC110875461 [Helianthus annuus]
MEENLVREGSSWKWRSDTGGSFSVRQVRSDIEKATMAEDNGSLVFAWNNWAPPKVNYLLWRALLDKIASKVGLIQRGIPLTDSVCPRCGLYDEDPDHIFVNCLWAQCVWWSILAWLRINFISRNKLDEFILGINQNLGDKNWNRIVYTIVMATVWRFWSARNEKVFKGIFIPIIKTVEHIKEDAFLWISNRSKLKKPKWEK